MSECLPKSVWPTPDPLPSTETDSSQWNTLADQIDELNNIDKISSFSDIKLNFEAKNNVQKYISANKVQLESSDLIPGKGISKLILIIENDLSYKAYHTGL